MSNIFDNIFRHQKPMLALPSGGRSRYEELELIAQQNYQQYAFQLENDLREALVGKEKALADLQELRVHTQRQAQKLQTLPKEERRQVILALIPFFDVLDYALVQASTESSHQWSEGFVMLQQSRNQHLKQLQIMTFGSNGEPFDPRFHESLDTEYGCTQQDIIARVYSAGYRFDVHPLRASDIIRPARVKVALARHSATA